MRGELSPLARVDYVPLSDGEHAIAPAVPPLYLAAEALAPYRGDVRLRVERGQLTLSAAPPIVRNGAAAAREELANGDVLACGGVRLLVAGLPKDPAVAVYDLQAAAYRGYGGLRYYPDDPRYVTLGRLERYPQPRPVRVAASRGDDKEQLALGVLVFTLAEQSAAVEVYAEREDSDRLFLIFKDQTSGQADGSYGAGRYLYARLLSKDEVLLDFNQAWNPMCAYSAYFHCPLPPRQNWLNFPIASGEKAYSTEH